MIGFCVFQITIPVNDRVRKRFIRVQSRVADAGRIEHKRRRFDGDKGKIQVVQVHQNLKIINFHKYLAKVARLAAVN